MFKAFERNPFLLDQTGWVRLRSLLADTTRCFPGFSGRSDIADLGWGVSSKRKTFPVHQWTPEETDFLLESGLIVPTIEETGCDQFLPACRLIHLRDGFHAKKVPTLICTDFPDNTEQRVFPWSDEAELLLRYLTHMDIQVPHAVLNLFCGTGSIAISLRRTWAKTDIVCSDINPRALQFVRFNICLNALDEVRVNPLAVVQSDMVDNVGGSFDLIIGIPPMALQPPGEEDIEHLHSAGGPMGTSVIEKMLKNCQTILNPGGKLIFLSHGLGGCGESREPLSLVNTLKSADLDGTWKIIPLPDEKIWRVGEEKRFTNPMPVQYMVSRLADPFYRSSHAANYERWEHWIEDILLKQRGFTHLHYVLVEYTAHLR